MGRRRLSPLIRSPKEVGFRRPGCWRDAGAFRPPWGSYGNGRPPPFPILPAPGDPPARRPRLTHRQRSAFPRSGPGTSFSRTQPRPLLPPAPPVLLSSQAAAARAGHGPMDQPAESFLGGKRRDGTGRGGAGEEGRKRAGRGRGEGGKRPAGRLLPRRKRLGRPVPGTAPRLLITTINNDEDGVLPRCQAMG